EAARLEAEMRALRSAPAVSKIALRRIWRMLDDHLSQFGDMLRGDLVAARHALSKLLVGRVRFTPVQLDNRNRTYELEAELTVGKLFATAVLTSRSKRPVRVTSARRRTKDDRCTPRRQ